MVEYSSCFVRCNQALLLLQTRGHRSDNERKCRLIARSALRAAIARLLDGRPERIDDALTVLNLAYEPASAGRRRIMRSVFSPSSGLPNPADGDHYSKPSTPALKAELRAMRGTEIAERPRPRARPVHPGADAAGRGPECRHREGVRQELA